ncbi:hypothetical protein [Rhizobium rhizosphaerae]|nr:hypothetical protein [Xaviernesmea rhizosphaerae]
MVLVSGSRSDQLETVEGVLPDLIVFLRETGEPTDTRPISAAFLRMAP